MDAPGSLDARGSIWRERCRQAAQGTAARLVPDGRGYQRDPGRIACGRLQSGRDRQDHPQELASSLRSHVREFIVRRTEMSKFTTNMPSFLTPSRRTFLKGAGIAAASTLATPYIARAQDNVIYINTWGGPWEESAREHLFDPFTAATGVEIRTVSPVSFAKLAQQVNTGVYEFDITTLGG